MTAAMEAISASKEIYPPSAETVAQAKVPDYLALRQRAVEDPVAFWDQRAQELIDWYEPYTTVLDRSSAPFFKWFVGGQTNIVHNALDRHVQSWRKNKLALLWEGENGYYLKEKPDRNDTLIVLCHKDSKAKQLCQCAIRKFRNAEEALGLMQQVANVTASGQAP